MNQKETRRNNGEGSVFYREDKGLWCACVQVGIDFNGRRKRKTIYAKSKKELLEKKKELESSILTGTYIESSKITLGEYLIKWLDEVCSVSIRPSTYLLYKGIIRKHIIPEIGSIPLNKITALQIQAFYNKKLNDGLSSSKVRHIHAILHKSFTQAVKWGMIRTNVTDLVQKPRIIRKELNVWDQDQIKLFLEEAKRDRYYCLFLLALTTGLRQGELIGLQWNDIDLENEFITVRRTVKELNGKLIIGEPKTVKGKRLVSLPKVAVSALKVLKKEKGIDDDRGDTWVFTDTKNGLIRVQNLYKRHYKKVIENAKLPYIRFHDLRHCHATLLLQQGINPKIVQERLGHSNISITLDIYSHVLPSMQKTVAKELDMLFG